jgi:hypothetical protein
MPNLSSGHRQRIYHIVTSYCLSGDEPMPFEAYLIDLMQVFPEPLIELAIVEVLVQQWLQVPLVRGLAFLQKTHQMLNTWQSQQIESRLTPASYELITGLESAPVFKRLEAWRLDCAGAVEGIARAIAPMPTTEMP